MAEIIVDQTDLNVTITPNTTQLNVFTGGYACAQGNTTEFQYNNGGVLAGANGLTYNSGTQTTTAANLAVTNDANLGAVGNVTITGGNVNQFLQTDGAGGLSFSDIANANYANFAGTVLTNAQPNITSVGNLSSLTVTGNATANYFIGNGSQLTGIGDGTQISNGTSNVRVNSANGNVSIGVNGNANILVATANGIVVTRANLGNISNLTITGGINGYVLQTDGTGNLSWTAGGSPTGNGVPGGANTQIQFNDGGAFGGKAGFTFNRVTDVLNTPGNLVVAGLLFGDAGLLSNVPGGYFIANGNSNIRIANSDGNATVTINNTTTTTFANNVINVAVAINTNSQINSTVANGTAPFTINSQTLVANLNADLLDGYTTATANTANTIALRDANGNLSANYLLGNGAFITGLDPASLANGNSNVRVFANSNVTISVAGNANILVTTGTGVNVSGTLNATGNANVGNLGATNIIGTIATAAQPIITSLGTLTGLSVNGNITAANITANTGIFTGNGSGLTSLTGANVTGTVANATYATSAGSANTAGTVTTAAQPNITSVGTLTNLNVSGNIGANGNITTSAGQFNGNAAGLTNIPGGNVNGQVANALVAGTVYTNAQPNITSVGTLSSLSVSGNVQASRLVSNVATGTSPLVVTSTTVVSNLRAATSNVANTVNDASQPNITSVGTLTTLTTSGNANVGGNLIVTGNLTVNGTAIIDSIRNGTSNVNIPAANGNVNISVGGVANTLVVTTAGATTNTLTATTANITTINSGLLKNGTSNVTINPSGNVYVSVAGNINRITVTGTGVDVQGTLNAAGNANVLNIGANIGEFTGNVTAANFIGDLRNGNSFINIVANGNIGISSQSGATEIIVTPTGVNVTGTMNVSSTLEVVGNANTLNLGTSRILATGNITATQLISNIATGTAPLVVTSTTKVANLNVDTVDGYDTSLTTTANTIVVRDANGSITANVVTANIITANLNGSANTANTVIDAAQPNITSVGTLTSLSVTGNISSGNANLGNAVFANYFTGNFYGTANIATTANTVTVAAQPNITSLGNLTTLTLSNSNIILGTGANAGTTPTGVIAIGLDARGLSNTAGNGFSIAIGYRAGYVGQATRAIAIGQYAGSGNAGGIANTANYQGINAIAIGHYTGYNSQKDDAIAIGREAGANNQGSYSIAIGAGASIANAGNNSIAIGRSSSGLGANSIALGYSAVANTTDSIAIGNSANAATANTIVINASGTALTGNTANALFIKPVRTVNSTAGLNALYYDSTTGEIVVYVP